MNINPTAIHAVSIAEEIGLIAGCIAAAIPNLPSLDDADAIALAAAVNADKDAVAAGVDTDEDAVAAAVDATVIDPDDTNDLAGFIVQGYVIEGTDDVTPHVCHHAITFYNALIPLFLDTPATWHLMDKANYY